MRIGVLAVFLLAAACAAERTLVFRAADRTPAGEPTMVQIRGARADIPEITCRSYSVRGDTLRMFCAPNTAGVELDDISIVRDGATHRIFYSVAHTAPDDGREVERIEAFYDPGFFRLKTLMLYIAVIYTCFVALLHFIGCLVNLIYHWDLLMCPFRILARCVREKIFGRPGADLDPRQLMTCLCPPLVPPPTDAIDGCPEPKGAEEWTLHAHETHKKERLSCILAELARLTHATEEEKQRAQDAIAAGDYASVSDMTLLCAIRAIRARIE